MNIPKMKQLARLLEEEPKRVNIWRWLVTRVKKGSDPRLNDYVDSKYKRHFRAPSCGTVGCIAGLACAMDSRGKLRKKGLSDLTLKSASPRAQAILGLTEGEADRLFTPGYWPEEYRRRLDQTRPGTKAHTRVVVDRLEHMIRTGE